MTEKEQQLAAALREREHTIERLTERLRQLGASRSLHCGKCDGLQIAGGRDLRHIPQCPLSGLEDRDAVIGELTALLTKAQWSLSGALERELRVALYHVERLRPMRSPKAYGWSRSRRMMKSRHGWWVAT